MKMFKRDSASTAASTLEFAVDSTADVMVAPAQRCVDQISATFGGYFDTVDQWRQAMAIRSWSGPAPTVKEVDSCVLDLISPDLSAAGTPLIGAGFVAAPGYVSDSAWFLAWWLGENNTLGLSPAGAAKTPAIRRLAANLDPVSESFRDYTTLEWWRIPISTRSSHITGPYVDYLCTDDYTLTLTTPVYRGADATDLIGVVGVDIYVKTIEALVLPQLQQIGGPATLVNAAGRIIASTDPHRAAGALLRVGGLTDFLQGDRSASTLDAGWRAVDCPRTTLAVVLGP